MTPLYLDHFGLAEAPFVPTPNPRFLFLANGHREALAHLLYGVQSDDGLVLLSGEVGSGKTTLCRCLLEQLPADCEVALLVNPRLDSLELLASICECFAIAAPALGSYKAYLDRIDAYLRESGARGRRPLLLIDEAQGLDEAVFEQIRLLTNLESGGVRLLRIVLAGQSSLRERLASRALQPLAQRLVARYHLGAFSEQESAGCVRHRLALAGARREIFTQPALVRLHRLSGGVPRCLLALAERAMLGAYAAGEATVAPETVSRAAGELPQPVAKAGARLGRLALAGVGAAGSIAALAAYVHYESSAMAPPPAIVQAPAAAGG